MDVGPDRVAFGCGQPRRAGEVGDRVDELGIVHGEIGDAHCGSGLSFSDSDGIAPEFFAPPA